MSIHDSLEKINPVRNRGSLRALAVSNGVKHWIEGEQARSIIVVLIVILVGLGGFELGRLSKSDSSTGIKISYNGESSKAHIISALMESKLIASPKPTVSAQTTGQVNGARTSKGFFASSRGTKYYPVGCAAGNTLKQENRIYFNSREEAEKAGYVLSSSCR